MRAPSPMDHPCNRWRGHLPTNALQWHMQHNNAVPNTRTARNPPPAGSVTSRTMWRCSQVCGQAWSRARPHTTLCKARRGSPPSLRSPAACRGGQGAAAAARGQGWAAAKGQGGAPVKGQGAAAAVQEPKEAAAASATATAPVKPAPLARPCRWVLRMALALCITLQITALAVHAALHACVASKAAATCSLPFTPAHSPGGQPTHHEPCLYFPAQRPSLPPNTRPPAAASADK